MRVCGTRVKKAAPVKDKRLSSGVGPSGGAGYDRLSRGNERKRIVFTSKDGTRLIIPFSSRETYNGPQSIILLHTHTHTQTRTHINVYGKRISSRDRTFILSSTTDDVVDVVFPRAPTCQKPLPGHARLIRRGRPLLRSCAPPPQSRNWRSPRTAGRVAREGGRFEKRDGGVGG